MFKPDRRRFLKASVATAIGAAAIKPSDLFAAKTSHLPTSSNSVIPPGIKIGVQVYANATDEELLFYKQIGVKYVRVLASNTYFEADALIKLRKRFEDAGLKIFTIVNDGIYFHQGLWIGLDDCEEKIENFKTFLRNMGKAGLHTLDYDWHDFYPGGMNTFVDYGESRFSKARSFDLEKAKKVPNAYDRVYTKEEMWKHYTYFIKAIMPTADEAGVRLAIHPDDPPVDSLAGVARIFHTFDDFKRGMKIANSENWGLLLCVGTWNEGTVKNTGKDIFEMIKYFGSRNRIFTAHFRNVSSPMPNFTETFLDNGYMDMYKIMKAFREVNYDGLMIPDHVPKVAAGRDAGKAYTVGYMQALLQRANEEVL